LPAKFYGQNNFISVEARSRALLIAAIKVKGRR
jgi:hypothetical protein